METQIPQQQAAAFRQLFDYAGLFPPAGLPMQETVGNFVRYQAEANAWMLNTIVVPAAKLGEFESAIQAVSEDRQPDLQAALRLSVLISDWDAESAKLTDLQKRGVADVVSIETRQVDRVAEMAEAVERVYVELPVGPELPYQLDEVAKAKAFAKIRTGGLVPEAFPTGEAVSQFILACAERNVGFKATAGLHHPFAKTRPACEAADAPLVPMHGFVNVLLAVANIQATKTIEAAVEILGRSQESALSAFEAETAWAAVAKARELFHSIGSCSFDEPIEDLRQLGWL